MRVFLLELLVELEAGMLLGEGALVEEVERAAGCGLREEGLEQGHVGAVERVEYGLYTLRVVLGAVIPCLDSVRWLAGKLRSRRAGNGLLYGNFFLFAPLAQKTDDARKLLQFKVCLAPVPHFVDSLSVHFGGGNVG